MYCVYIYFVPVFDRARARRLNSVVPALAVGPCRHCWWPGGTWLCDRRGGRALGFSTLAFLGLNFVALPLAAAAIGSALASIAVWGFCGMMLSIALQRQLIERAPTQTAVLSACFVCALQSGIATAGGIGGALIGKIGAHQLPLLGSAFLAFAVLVQWIARSQLRRHPEAAPHRQSKAARRQGGAGQWTTSRGEFPAAVRGLSRAL